CSITIRTAPASLFPDEVERQGANPVTEDRSTVSTPSHHPTSPTWVSKRDGRLVPFDADKISRALFAATESLGRPDAFMARELTDSIVHFLAPEADNSTLTSAQVAELVIKIVRELGQPALSQAFNDFARKRVHTSQKSSSPPLAPE